MNTEKVLDVIIKSGAIITSARKINKTVSVFRILSYAALAVAVIINVAGLVASQKSSI